MQVVVAEAMAGGAAGFASSMSPTHNGDHGRPVPSRVADAEQLGVLPHPLRQGSRGVVALLPGGVMDHEEVFALQREIGRPFTWTALSRRRKGYPYHEKVIAEHDAAWADGVEVWPQASCRPLVFQMNLSEPFTLNMRPTFAALMGKTKDQRLATYRDPAWRQTAWDEVSGGRGGFPVNWANISVAESASHPDLIDRPVMVLAEERGCTPLYVTLDISLDDNLEARFWSVLANDDPEGIALLSPRTTCCSVWPTRGVHVSQLCDACFSTDLLGNWVREKGVMPIERAIHKLTGEPAQVYGLADRGTVAVGQAADLCVFDPQTVAPGPLRRIRDFPADGERLTADAPLGVTHVLVNGIPSEPTASPTKRVWRGGPGFPAALTPGPLLGATTPMGACWPRRAPPHIIGACPSPSWSRDHEPGRPHVARRTTRDGVLRTRDTRGTRPDLPIDPDFVEEVEQDPSLNPALQVDDRELDEAGLRLDDPESLASLDGGIDDPDGIGEPPSGAP